MKLSCILVVLMIVSLSLARITNYNELVEELKQPDVEIYAQQLLDTFASKEVLEMLGGHAYDVARSGVGCASGFFGGLNTGFTIYDIILQDPTDPGAYVFGVIYAIAWWQQNGQYMEYMCKTFWDLTH